MRVAYFSLTKKGEKEFKKNVHLNLLFQIGQDGMGLLCLKPFKARETLDSR